MITKNEYIASIMLEAADLLKKKNNNDKPKWLDAMAKKVMKVIENGETISVNDLDKLDEPINKHENNTKAIKEAIDLLYDKAMECDTIDEVTEYINKAEQLESLIEIDE